MSKSCPNCGTDVHEPFIRCLDCRPSIDVCPGCFAKGKEFGQHRNEHAYEVRQNNFTILEDGWTAAEELKLLESLIELGYGNWNEVAKQMQTKDSDECKKHYGECYIDNPVSEISSLLETQFRTKELSLQRLDREIPFKTSEDPPRPFPMSDAAMELSGYMPCRGDFDVEYDNYAETSIKDIEFTDSDDELSIECKIAAVDIFYSRIKERNFRKKVVRKYGLINIFKDASVSYAKQERMIRESLRVFARLQHPEENEMFIQGVLLQSSLMKQIKLLQSYRKVGLKRRRDAVIYKKLYAERQEAKTKRTLLSEISCHIDMPMSCQLWLHKQFQCSVNTKEAPLVNTFPSLSRKQAAPLDLTGMPGVELLQDEEKELCSQLRIAPAQYMTYKNTLLKESQRLGTLKLQQARPLIKIDVNKTKKLYDYFIEKGWIKTDEQK